MACIMVTGPIVPRASRYHEQQEDRGNEPVKAQQRRHKRCRADQRDGVHAEQQAIGGGRNAVHRDENLRRSGEVGEKPGLREGAGQNG